jgi:hypothetical protein
MLKLLIAMIIVTCWSLVIQEKTVLLWTDNNEESKATAAAYSYAQSFSNIDRRLLFVHIPKTAGSTMEMDVALGQDKQLTWGKCMFLDGLRGCPWRRDAKYRFGRPLQTLPPYWHIPVHYFPLYNYNPYDADTFAVIRHPVDRAVSEYYYTCTRGTPRQRGKELCKNMTNFILTGLDPKEAKNFVYPRADFHWISQHDFIVGPFETRTVDHIMQMEDMSPHFEQLAAAFGLSHLHWPVARKNAAPSLNSTKAAELPKKLSNKICEYPYVVDDLLLWNNSAAGRDLFPKAKYGHLCKA